MNEEIGMAVNVMQDAIVAGDNREYALANIAEEFDVTPMELKAAFEAVYKVSYLDYVVR